MTASAPDTHATSEVASAPATPCRGIDKTKLLVTLTGAAARGVANAWRVNLERRGAPRPHVAPRLVELVPTTPSAPVARYVLHVGGVELELCDEFHEDTVRRLVQVLLSC